MVELLMMMIKSKGEVLDRKKMFSKIWKTDYTEDTRSLDVHINWLRKIIEKDPDNPQLIVTERGKGYKLDL
jgi:DNA-binding response OmpR family regulator